VTETFSFGQFSTALINIKADSGWQRRNRCRFGVAAKSRCRFSVRDF
jgi:hypothetical protein